MDYKKIAQTVYDVIKSEYEKSNDNDIVTINVCCEKLEEKPIPSVIEHYVFLYADDLKNSITLEIIEQAIADLYDSQRSDSQKIYVENPIYIAWFCEKKMILIGY